MTAGLALPILEPRFASTPLGADALAVSLTSLGNVDFETGRVWLDEEQLKTTFQRFFDAENARRGFEDMLSLARDGFAVFGDPSLALRGSPSVPEAVPWKSLHTLLQSGEELPDTIFAGLGIDPSSTQTQAVKEMRRRFSSVPAYMTEPETVEKYLCHRPAPCATSVRLSWCGPPWGPEPKQVQRSFGFHGTSAS